MPVSPTLTVQKSLRFLPGRARAAVQTTFNSQVGQSTWSRGRKVCVTLCPGARGWGWGQDTGIELQRRKNKKFPGRDSNPLFLQLFSKPTWRRKGSALAWSLENTLERRHHHPFPRKQDFIIVSIHGYLAGQDILQSTKPYTWP